MLVEEVLDNPQMAQLTALSQFLVSRAKDTNARMSISVDSFINLAKAQGISLTPEQLKTLSQTPPLSNIISDVTGSDTEPGEVVFRGAEIGSGQDTMTVDQARQTVDSMSKRAAKKGL